MMVKSSHLVAAIAGLTIGAFGFLHYSAHAQSEESPAEAAATPSAPGQVDSDRLVNADKDPGNWMTYGRTYSEQRFSQLNKINADNVKDLGLAWYYDLDTNRGQEATPIVVDGVMYISTAWSLVKAFDAKTGKLLWDFDPKVGREILIHVCCDAVNRGVAVWKGKVYVGTIDGRLIALDAATGKVVWSVDTIDKTKPYTITSAPRVFNDKVVIGNSGSEYGVRGYMSAYDTDSGKLLWRTYTVPGDPSKGFESPAMELAARTWNGKWWERGGGGTIWGGISYDPDLDMLYFGTANGVEWDQKHRSPAGGDNLYLASIIALKGSTGEYMWHYQVVPGDVWDYDATQDVVLADLTIDGKLRKVAMQAGKDGYIYVLDRKTGELISANNFVPVNWSKGIDMKTGRPIEVPEARYDKTGKMFQIFPGPGGGHNWQPMAFNPQTGLVYIPAQSEPFPFASDKNFKPTTVGNNMAIDFAKLTVAADATKKALKDEKGFLLAWDPVHQKEVWRYQHMGPWASGIMTTAGNLVFQGNAAHDFCAYRADNGQKLWSSPVQTAVLAGAMTYEVDGEQYVATLVGWGGSYAILGGRLSSISGPQRNISRLLVYKLGGTATLPPPAAEEAKVLDPPTQTASPAIIAEGKKLYGRNCVMCHGADVISGGLNPDLRYTKLLHDAGGWDNVVLRGTRKDQGMVSFAKNIDEKQSAAIRAFIIQRAIDSKVEESKQAKN
jgi:quinohemoprotein ethanol dehydrogenase